MFTVADSVHVEPSSTKPAPALFPFLDLQAQFKTIRNEVMAAITRTMESQHFILGPEVQKFETKISDYIGCKFAIGCASGSDALLLALMALGVGPGDEVITTPFTFVATAGSIARLGAKPVFVDIDPVTFNLDPRLAAEAVTTKTKAIIPVHLYGLAADMGALIGISNAAGIPLVEDAAQALGAMWQGKKVGNIGTIGCFSFFPSKNLGGAGDGGMLTTNDPDIADRLRLLRIHGSRSKYHCEIVGTNSRLDALQAVILGAKLPHLEQWTEGRRKNADRYRALVAERDLNGRVIVPTESKGARHVYNQFVIRVPERDSLRQHLLRLGIPTEIYYPEPLHMQPAFAHLRCSCPESIAASREVLALPIYPELADGQLSTVVRAIADFYIR